MNPSSQGLNLARKWRPSSFDTIVGQEIPVKMLKNSLYLNKFFPVYLFAGQRGCGKTSTARIFATASNCDLLKTFQSNPSQKLPCLNCQSCTLMQNNNHPDFIEIDAASNTGVDNVRQLIDTASYVPLIGSKKIFLIDEAHMLSKAAFNAFLKILEEPPKAVIFILDKTELHKIPQTVLSRCFHINFTLLDHASLHDHLQKICSQEAIVIESNAIDTIIQETEGSARDAINLLEQVRFAHEHITTDHVLNLLGKLSNETIYTLLEATIEHNTHNLITILSGENFDCINPEILWKNLVEGYKAILWLKYDAQIKTSPLASLSEKLHTLAQQSPFDFILFALQKLWDQESIFLQTSKKRIFLEMVLVQISAYNSNSNNYQPDALEKNNTKNIPVPVKKNTSTQTAPQQTNNATPITIKNNIVNEKPSVQIIKQAITNHAVHDLNADAWSVCKQALTNAHGDPVATSILLQATISSINNQTKTLIIALNQYNKFLIDALEESRQWWQPIICSHFNTIQTITFVQNEHTTHVIERKQPTVLTTQEKTPLQEQLLTENHGTTPKDWPIATMIKKHLPGKLKKSQLPQA